MEPDEGSTGAIPAGFLEVVAHKVRQSEGPVQPGKGGKRVPWMLRKRAVLVNKAV